LRALAGIMRRPEQPIRLGHVVPERRLLASLAFDCFDLDNCVSWVIAHRILDPKDFESAE
jgi:hypothetical protein